MPLSEIILLDTPKRHIIFSFKKLAIELPVAFFIATASTHLVNSLVATNIHVHPSERGGGGKGYRTNKIQPPAVEWI